jgi:uncharacterized membrane protein YphA (DoxX/SURF4 family)
LRDAFLLVLRFALGTLLIVAGGLKLRDPNKFALEIGNYQLLPEWAPVMAATLPAIEIVLGAALMILPRPWRQGAAAAATVLMAMFTFVVTAALVRGVNIECGCFGGGEGPITALTVGRNVVLLLVAAVVTIAEGKARRARS